MTIEYIAGLFDGEGCISSNTNTSGVPTAVVQFGMQHEGVVRGVFEFFACGAVYVTAATNAPLHRWSVQKQEDVHRVLSMLEPHLLVKRDQALLAIELAQRTVLRTGKSTIGKGCPLTDEERLYRQTLGDLIKSSKRSVPA